MRIFHAVDSDLFVRLSSPPSSDTLSWRDHIYDDGYSRTFEEERPVELRPEDKAPTYRIGIAHLKKDGKLSDMMKHRQVKYLNNVSEADHGKLKQLTRPVRKSKTLRTAYTTVNGFEVMRALKKGQAKLFQFQDGIIAEARLIERQFSIYTF